MRFFFYFGHPAQYLFLRATIKELLKESTNKVLITIKSKDVLEELLKADQITYTNIQSKPRGHSKFSIILSLLKRFFKLLSICFKFKPDLMIGTDATIAQVGFLLRIHRITITEDDYNIIKSLAKLSYPFTEHILCPTVCDVGKWSDKKIGYSGYMKLGYLHPKVFKAANNVLVKYSLKPDFAIIRLAKLTAHHDFGIKGINEAVLKNIIQKVIAKGISVYISSEKELPVDFHSYLLKIEPSDMHHVLAHAHLLISDSQSMSVEAAMLGIPSVRISDFAGRISVLEELEHKYQLTFGIPPDRTDKVFSKIDELLSLEDSKAVFSKRKEIMLAEKINVTDFLVWFLTNYPSSTKTMSESKSFQNNLTQSN